MLFHAILFILLLVVSFGLGYLLAKKTCDLPGHDILMDTMMWGMVILLLLFFGASFLFGF